MCIICNQNLACLLAGAWPGRPGAWPGCLGGGGTVRPTTPPHLGRPVHSPGWGDATGGAGWGENHVLQPCAEQPRLGLSIHEPHLPASSPEDPQAPTSFGNLGVSTPARFLAGPCCGDPGIMSPNSCSLGHPSPTSCS